MSEKKQNFVAQAGILAMAGIICRIIGILYRSPLTSIIGDEGNGYYSTAYNIYTIILLISSYSIPGAVSKAISQRLAMKEYRNAQSIFRTTLVYVCVVGGIASLFAFFAAPILVDENSAIVLRIFAPTIFLSGLLGVLRGYFQAYRTMVPTSYSQILEQIFNAVFSIVMAWFFMHRLAAATETDNAIHGAMGSAMGTGIGVLSALIFMFAIYLVNRRTFAKLVRADKTPKANYLSQWDIFEIIYMIVLPFILSTFIYNFSISLNQEIFSNILRGAKHITTQETVTLYGIFSGKSWVIINIPIAFASAMSSAIIPTISGTYAKGDLKGAHAKISTGVQATMLIAIPSFIGLFVLARPVMQLLFPQRGSLELASSVLRALSIAVVFYSLSTLSNAILQATGFVNQPVKNAALALVFQTIVLIPLLLFTNLNLYALAIAAILYSGLMCVLNARSLHKLVGYRQDYKKSFLLPLVSALIMGVFSFGSYRVLNLAIKSNTICLFFAILVSVAVYAAALIVTGALEEADILALPKGTLLLRLVKKTRLLSLRRH